MWLFVSGRPYVYTVYMCIYSTSSREITIHAVIRFWSTLAICNNDEWQLFECCSLL